MPASEGLCRQARLIVDLASKLSFWPTMRACNYRHVTISICSQEFGTGRDLNFVIFCLAVETDVESSFRLLNVFQTGEDGNVPQSYLPRDTDRHCS
jgi:hypothetical protein